MVRVVDQAVTPLKWTQLRQKYAMERVLSISQRQLLQPMNQVAHQWATDFGPTDEELVYHYLKSKILGTESHEGIIPVIEAYKMDPWFISGSCYFFQRYKQMSGVLLLLSFHPMFPNRNRVRRRTTTGYWAKTGPDSESKGEATEEVIGTKKTFVFKMHGDRDRGVADINTGWVIHEYSACMDSAPANKTLVLCRLKTNRVWFSPTINNGKLPKQLSNQETWPMNMDVDDSSTDTGFHLNGPPNIMGWVGQLDTSPWETRGTQLMVTRGTCYQPDHHRPDSPKDMHGTVILSGPPQGKANDVSASPIQGKQTTLAERRHPDSLHNTSG
ncbi:NAC domain-containing protein 89 [Vitis vinifera]|uniref:NAC domain-containing protein 89 n=1 Tax=Vitis vinifera TaxID=29760 RepID=A0A438HL13_VITVI|nr:NAC domain-containing protein 89 [Vitis vinifera]